MTLSRRLRPRRKETGQASKDSPVMSGWLHASAVAETGMTPNVKWLATHSKTYRCGEKHDAD